MILITGANGLVGSFICRKYLDAGFEVSILVRPSSDLTFLKDIEGRIKIHYGDILDVLSLEQAMQGCKTVVHSAALVSLLGKERKKMFKVNIEGTKNVVNTCLKMGVEELIHISSIAALGRIKEVIQIDENAKWTQSKLNSGYAETKYLSELEVWRGMEEGLNIIIVNPSVVLGIGNWNKSSGQIFKYVHDGNAFYTKGKVNYVDVRDIADAVFILHQNRIYGERFILNAGVSTYKDLFNLIAKELGKKAPSFRVGTILLWMALVFDQLKSLFTRKSPLITRETVILSEMNFFFDNKKIIENTGIDFRPLQETVRWVCGSQTP